MDKTLVTCMLYLKGLFVFGNPCLELPVQLSVPMLILEKLWSVAETAERWWLLNTMPPLLLLLHDWVAVVPKHFHFAIKPLTADCWIYLVVISRLVTQVPQHYAWMQWALQNDSFFHKRQTAWVGAWFYTPVAMRLKVVAQCVCPYSVFIVYATKENPQNMFQLFKKDRKLIVLQALKEQKVIITTVILIISSFDIFKYRYMLRLGLEMLVVDSQVFDLSKSEFR